MRLLVVVVLASAVALVGCQRRAQLDPRVSGEVVQQPVAPPSLSGGTLAVLSDGVTAVVADPDRDRLLLVDLPSRSVSREIALAPHAEPGRVAEDGRGRVLVALRGSGELLSLDPRDASAAPVARAACAMPRGVAYDASRDQVLVACRGGELVAFDGASGEQVSRVVVAPDLRDVLVVGGRRFVTTFRAAQLLEIAEDGAVISSRAPEGVSLATSSGADTYTPSVAWRAIVIPGTTTIAMVHQRGRSSPITLHASGGAHATRTVVQSSYAASLAAAGAANATCRSSVVHGAVTFFELDGSMHGGGAIVGAVLPVDLAARDGNVSLVAAGNQAGSDVVFSASVAQLAGISHAGDGCAITSRSGGNAATAIAFDGAGERLVLERDPSVLVVGDTRVALGGAEVFDTGHALFHGNAGTGDACASCHPEGGDDGRVWDFDGDARRTQSVSGGVLATAPFHWDGSDASFDALVGDVFETRMGGPRLSDAQVSAFGGWIDALPAAHGSVNDADAVARGRAVFEGPAGCATCHAGEHLTNNLSAEVGTTLAPVQVPSLVGLSLRLPLMRSGCATSIARRIDDPACGGGTAHGDTASLDAAQRSDLLAYLESL